MSTAHDVLLFEWRWSVESRVIHRVISPPSGKALTWYPTYKSAYCLYTVVLGVFRMLICEYLYSLYRNIKKDTFPAFCLMPGSGWWKLKMYTPSNCEHNKFAKTEVILLLYTRSFFTPKFKKKKKKNIKNNHHLFWAFRVCQTFIFRHTTTPPLCLHLLVELEANSIL